MSGALADLHQHGEDHEKLEDANHSDLLRECVGLLLFQLLEVDDSLSHTEESHNCVENKNDYEEESALLHV